jgi:hypothetical protein
VQQAVPRHLLVAFVLVSHMPSSLAIWSCDSF